LVTASDHKATSTYPITPQRCRPIRHAEAVHCLIRGARS
jgi:hypothetical protein